MPLKLISKASTVSYPGGGGGNNNGVVITKLSVRPTDAVTTVYPLPAKCMILWIVVRMNADKDYEVVAGDGVHANAIIAPLQSYLANEVQMSAPNMFIEYAYELKLQASGAADGLSCDIYYTTTTV